MVGGTGGRRRRNRAAIVPDAAVELRRPWRLRGMEGVARRRVVGGWEVEIRSPAGTPLHLVARTRTLRAI